MASSCNYSAENVPVVLRVKRKREEEPVDALVVAKVAKLDPSLSSGSGAEPQKVFHLVSVGQDHHLTHQEVLARISHYKKRSPITKLSSFAGLSISERQEEQRKSRKVQVSTRRFKLVSKLRSLEGDSGKLKSGQQKSGSQPQSVHLYDFEQDCNVEDASGSPDVCRGGQAFMEDKTGFNPNRSIITCNSTPMVCERLPAGSSDYVYDLYYAQSNSSIQEMMVGNWMNICAHPYQPELVHNFVDPDEECYEDEDDSNDEDNWRNDYPDEQSSDDRSSEDFYDEDTAHYRAHFCASEDDDDKHLGADGYHLDGSYWSRS